VAFQLLGGCIECIIIHMGVFGTTKRGRRGEVIAAAVTCRLAVGGDVIHFRVAGEVVELLRKASVIFGAPAVLGVEGALGAALLSGRRPLPGVLGDLVVLAGVTVGIGVESHVNTTTSRGFGGGSGSGVVDLTADHTSHAYTSTPTRASKRHEMHSAVVGLEALEEEPPEKEEPPPEEEGGGATTQCLANALAFSTPCFAISILFIEWHLGIAACFGVTASALLGGEPRCEGRSQCRCWRQVR
jgi:hypothetical protein